MEELEGQQVLTTSDHLIDQSPGGLAWPGPRPPGWAWRLLGAASSRPDWQQLSTVGKFPALEDIQLGGNSIGDAGVQVLAGVLSSGAAPRLRSLSLWGNRIGCAGAAALAGALPSLPALEELDLHTNNIGARGRAALQEVRPWILC